MNKILVLGYESYARPFYQYGKPVIATKYSFNPPSHPKKKEELPKFVVFTGGNDISPFMYGEEYQGSYGCDRVRDLWEKRWFEWCRENKVPMVGICRGLQFFTAMEGGKLIQDIPNGAHSASTHYLDTETPIMVNSLHHQACILPSTAICLAKALHVYRSPAPWLDSVENNKDKVEHDDIVEAAWFPEAKAFGVQFHPEMMTEGSDGLKWFDKQMETYIC